jgi:hypothetical protein
MATFTDWMRLGEARLTPLATLALGAGMAWLAPEVADAARAATGERAVSGVRITLGEEGRRWTLVPTLLDGKVESFLALREDVAFGENLTAVWYRKVAAADGMESWETKAFEDQDQSKAIRAVKQALALADSTDESWPVPMAAVAAAEPEPMVKGVLESDALAPLVADLDDPQPIVEMLEGAGWKAAWIGPLEGVRASDEPSVFVECPRSVVLSAAARAVEVTTAQDLAAGLQAATSELAGCGWCVPGWLVLFVNDWGDWTCAGPWTLKDSQGGTGGGGQAGYCYYERVVTRTRVIQEAYEDSDCNLTSFRTKTETETRKKFASCEHVPHPPAPCPAAPGSSCTSIPSDCNPSEGG